MKSKAYIVGIIIILLIIGVVFYVYSDTDRVGTEIELALFGNRGLIYIPFAADIAPGVRVQIQSTDQEMASDISIRPHNNMRTGIPVSIVGTPEVGTEITITIDQEVFTRKITKITREEDLLDLETVTNPEESMKGWGSIAYAQTEPVTNAYRPGVPDIGQRIAECAPTSAANSIISLAEEHGAEYPDDQTIINELKGDMDWTPENGVLPPQFVEGKNKWAARHGLPIRTEIVGDKNGKGTLESIMDAMDGGAAAEIRIKFADNTGKATGGHMVTVVGVRVEGDQTFIEINDPRTPEGADTYEMNGNVIEGYPYDGQAILSWGFVQRWEGTPTGVPLEQMTDDEVRGIQNAAGVKEKIKVIIYGNHKIPLSQVHVAPKDKCDGPHYHANSPDHMATDTEGQKVKDPNETNPCGFGKVQNVPVEEVEMP